MTRVATIPLQRTMSDAIQRTQGRLADTQRQLSTGIRAPDFAALGAEAVRTLSARSLVSTQRAYTDTATRLGTTLAIYDANITGIDTLASTLRNDMLLAIGTGQAAGLQDALEAAFDQVRSALNASERGLPLFGGAQAGQPFAPRSRRGAKWGGRGARRSRVARSRSPPAPRKGRRTRRSS